MARMIPDVNPMRLLRDKYVDEVKFMWNWESVNKDTLHTIVFERIDPEEITGKQQEKFLNRSSAWMRKNSSRSGASCRKHWSSTKEHWMCEEK